MLIWITDLIQQIYDGPGFLRLAGYLSFRTVMAAMTAFLFSLIVGGRLIRLLHRLNMRDVVEDYGVIDVGNKRGTPTMGGLILILAGLGSAVFWCRPDSPFAIAAGAALLWYGSIGFLDDLMKVRGGGGSAGLSQLAKIVLQSAFALAFAWWLLSLHSPLPEGMRLYFFVPFQKAALFPLSPWIAMGWVWLVFIAVSNSVNFADGMDGLATVPAAVSFMVYAIFAYVLGNEVYSGYLQFQYLKGAGELTVFAGAMIGACLGFLWYNFFPAQVFMGDTGSMALGGLLASVMLMLRQEVLFVIVGGIFVIEGASVLIQEKIGFNLLGRRILFRAPIHHGFEHRGVSETKLVIRFWILALILGFIGLLTLKVR